MKTQGSRRIPKFTQPEKEQMMNVERLDGFDPHKCQASCIITELFGEVNGQDLLALAKVCSSYLKIHLDREAIRRSVVLMKWFDENLQAIEPFLRTSVVVENENKALGSNDAVDRLAMRRQNKSGI
jgi:hypothetical protein